jgi:hypothetical protein
MMYAEDCGLAAETEEAETLRWEFNKAVTERVRVSRTKEVWARTCEHATKLSMILALSEMPKIQTVDDGRPMIIEKRHVEWSNAVATYCAQHMEKKVILNISENPYDGRFKYLLERIKLNKTMKASDWKQPRHQADDRIIKQMLEDDIVVKVKIESKRGRPPTVYQYVGD